MTKNALITKLAMPLFLLGLCLSSVAYIPLVRKLVGIDATIGMPFSTMLIWLIAGSMAAIAGMISLTRKRSLDHITYKNENMDNTNIAIPYVLGLALLLIIPFANFVAVYYGWLKNRNHSTTLDEEYRCSLNFQITVQLYFLMCLFLLPIGIGFLLLPLLILLHIVGTLFVVWRRLSGNKQGYPATIKIIPVSIKPAV
ncbi:MAG: DUF4870 domain-containing protein [Arenicella sp.]